MGSEMCIRDRVEQTVSFTLPEDGGNIGTADIIFVVDESFSMAGEQAWLGNIIESLDDSLRATGLNQNRYSLVGFGNANRIIQTGEDEWMTAAEFGVATDMLRTPAVFAGEDGYSGINFALDNLNFRDEASRVVVLVTDEGRTNPDDSVTFSSLQSRFDTEEVVFSVVANANFENGVGDSAFGVAADNTAFSSTEVTDDTIESTGGTFIGSVPGGDTANIGPQYVELGWAADGVVWDLNFLRQDENAANTFTEVFVDILGETIVRDIPINVVASDSNIDFTNLSGIQTDIAPGQTVDFDVEFDGQTSSRFDISFVNANTNEVLGSIPVSVNNDYRYQVEAIDADSDSLEYELLEGPEGLQIDSQTGLITWDTDAGLNGTFAVTVEVGDGRGGFDEQSFEIEISEAGTGTIEGIKFEDLNGNGIRESDEPGLEDWVIYLDQNRNGTLDLGERFTLTDSDGDYRFTGLPEARYLVREVLPAGWNQTSAGTGASLLLNGDFENDEFTLGPDGERRYIGWTERSTNDGFSLIFTEGTNGISSFDITGTRLDGEDSNAPDFFSPFLDDGTPNLDLYAAVRPSGPAPVNSFSELISDPFIVDGPVSADIWRESARSVSRVTFHRELDDSVLASFELTEEPQLWHRVSFDTTELIGELAYVVLYGGTSQSGRGWLTIFDNVFGGNTQLEAGVSQGIEVFVPDESTVSDVDFGNQRSPQFGVNSTPVFEKFPE